jgi:hypothetical protein
MSDVRCQMSSSQDFNLGQGYWKNKVIDSSEKSLMRSEGAVRHVCLTAKNPDQLRGQNDVDSGKLHMDLLKED